MTGASRPVWRVVLSPPANGALNMAIDQAILEAVAAKQAPPTLRLYAWTPACLSLGYVQPVADVDRARLARLGWNLVRRITGGRAILHVDEITYSIAFPDGDPVIAGGIIESYRRLSRALVAGLHHLGALPQADQRTRDDGRDPHGPVCFEVPSHYEITVDGQKLVGSAQVRKFGGVLQHGTLPLHGDITRICDVLQFATEDERHQARRRVYERATTVERVLGYAVDWNTAARVLSDSFHETFGVQYSEQSALIPAEQHRARELVTGQYADANWIARF